MKIIFNSNAIHITPSRYDSYPLCTTYTSILQVAKACASMEIPYELTRSRDGWRIGFDNGENTADIIETKYSYGNERNLMESMGFEEDFQSGPFDVSGSLTVQEVLRRIYRFYQIK